MLLRRSEALDPGVDEENFITVDHNNIKSEVIVATSIGEGGKRDKSHITCHKCGETCHIANECSNNSVPDS
jgi:hypothetical protein